MKQKRWFPAVVALAMLTTLMAARVVMSAVDPNDPPADPGIEYCEIDPECQATSVESQEHPLVGPNI